MRQKWLIRIRNAATFFAIISSLAFIFSIALGILSVLSPNFFLYLPPYLYQKITYASLIALIFLVLAETNLDDYITKNYPSPCQEEKMASCIPVPVKRTLLHGLIRLAFYLSIMLSSSLVVCWGGLSLMELAKIKEVGNWHFFFLVLLIVMGMIIFVTNRLNDKLEEKRGTFYPF